jgi:hypothetical protein
VPVCRFRASSVSSPHWQPSAAHVRVPCCKWPVSRTVVRRARSVSQALNVVSKPAENDPVPASVPPACDLPVRACLAPCSPASFSQHCHPLANWLLACCPAAAGWSSEAGVERQSKRQKQGNVLGHHARPCMASAGGRRSKRTGQWQRPKRGYELWTCFVYQAGPAAPLPLPLNQAGLARFRIEVADMRGCRLRLYTDARHGLRLTPPPTPPLLDLHPLLQATPLTPRDRRATPGTA